MRRQISKSAHTPETKPCAAARNALDRSRLSLLDYVSARPEVAGLATLRAHGRCWCRCSQVSHAGGFGVAGEHVRRVGRTPSCVHAKFSEVSKALSRLEARCAAATLEERPDIGADAASKAACRPLQRASNHGRDENLLSVHLASWGRSCPFWRSDGGCALQPPRPDGIANSSTAGTTTATTASVRRSRASVHCRRACM
jgi:hypothetical protein